MAREIHPFEVWSGEQFFAAQAGQAEYPGIVLFERHNPKEVDEGGLYIGYRDFNDVLRYRSRRIYTASEPYVRLFHALVVHFAGLESQEFEDKARADLINQPYNSSGWNKQAPTWRYWLLGSMLLPYADMKVNPEFKIKDVGLKGREIMRAVLFDEVEVDPTGTELVRTPRYDESEAIAPVSYSVAEFGQMSAGA